MWRRLLAVGGLPNEKKGSMDNVDLLLFHAELPAHVAVRSKNDAKMQHVIKVPLRTHNYNTT